MNGQQLFNGQFSPIGPGDEISCEEARRQYVADPKSIDEKTSNHIATCAACQVNLFPEIREQLQQNDEQNEPISPQDE